MFHTNNPIIHRFSLSNLPGYGRISSKLLNKARENQEARTSNELRKRHFCTRKLIQSS